MDNNDSNQTQTSGVIVCENWFTGDLKQNDCGFHLQILAYMSNDSKYIRTGTARYITA